MTITMQPIPNYGNRMPLSKFVNYCKSGAFIDYDGWGCYATATEMTDIVIKPSHVTSKRKRILKRFTHVVWFNR